MVPKSSIYKKDVRLFLIFIPFINLLNYYLTYTHMSFTWRTGVTFTLDTIEGYMAWLTLRYIIIFLDSKISLANYPVRRIVFQLLATIIAGLSIIIALTLLTNFIAGNKPIPRSFFTSDILIFLIWFFVVNAIYIGWYYFDLWKQSEQSHREQKHLIDQKNRRQTEGLIVKTGKNTHVIEYSRIAGFFIENEYPFVATIEAEKYILDGSLDKIEKTLPADLFFRINRQILVHRQIISGFKRLENGKISLTFKDGQEFFEFAQMSRTKAPEFKAWLRSEFIETDSSLDPVVIL